MARSLLFPHPAASGGLSLKAGRPGTETAPVVEREAPVIPRYKVLLHNDDVNSMEHVVHALRKVFKFELEVCVRIMLEAHDQGVALCTIEPLEQAELHRDQLLSLSLVATIEPE
jgi:ATP-dependent Clp protease adaptor protein ClpS